MLSLILACVSVLAGCSTPADTGAADVPDAVEEQAEPESAESKDDKEDKEKDDAESSAENKDKTGGKKSLAQRMAGKYSFHHSDENGNDEFYIMDVVPFGDNLIAFCGIAMPEDYESFEAYTFWASEFIPYNADEMRSTDNDTVAVNEMRFSIMSNAGMYWDAGRRGTITYTDDGLVFEGFMDEDFLVPDNDDSRLFLKDERVEDAFRYLTDGKGSDELEGLWILDRKGGDLYMEFSGSNMYMYSKDPSREVFYAAGGCEYSDGSFSWNGSAIENGGMPFELEFDYKTDGNILTLSTSGPDTLEEIPSKGNFKKVKDGRAHVITVDEMELGSDSFGPLGAGSDIEVMRSEEFYGVFVSAAKDPDMCQNSIGKLEEDLSAVSQCTPLIFQDSIRSLTTFRARDCMHLKMKRMRLLQR